MTRDEKVPFLVVATHEGPNPFTYVFFVRALTLQDAYVDVLQRRNGVCQHPNIRLQAFVVGASEMAQALQLKELAEFYWKLGASQEFPIFEDAWHAHGAEPDDA